LFVPWLVVALACAVLMIFMPGAETVPYHLAWIAVAVAYGVEAWPWGMAMAGITAYTLLTGAILVVRAANGVIAWEETTEIPMMTLLIVLVVWHIRRRHVAYAGLTEAVRRDREHAAQRERLRRMTSHEMRTPVTIAKGYAELLLQDETDPARRDDLHVICEELDRLVLTSDRLVRMMRLEGEERHEPVDLDKLVRDTVVRWSVLADRRWSTESALGTHLSHRDGLRACLDTLLENAVRYTHDGDRIRISGSQWQGWLLLAVADSGPGLEEDLVRALNRGEVRPPGGDRHYRTPDPKAQTGFGIAIVHEVVRLQGGSLRAGVSREGGALVLMAIPAAPAPVPDSEPVTSALA
jgi:signal transduction histidine kinase